VEMKARAEIQVKKKSQENQETDRKQDKEETTEEDEKAKKVNQVTEEKKSGERKNERRKGKNKTKGSNTSHRRAKRGRIKEANDHVLITLFPSTHFFYKNSRVKNQF